MKQTTRYWRSSMYIGKDTRTDFQDPGGTTSFLTHNFDVDEVYLAYSVSDSSVKLRVWLHATGQFILLLWQGSSKTWLEQGNLPVDNYDFYAHCGPNSACCKGKPLSSSCKCLIGFTIKFPNQSAMGNWSNGCVREKMLTCGNGIQGNFPRLENVRLSDPAVLLENRSMSQCHFDCQQNCSYTAYAHVNDTDGSNIGKCLAWFGELLDLVENHYNSKRDIYIRVHGSEPGKMGLFVNSLKRTIVTAIASATVGLFTITCANFL